jgi:hypothetical protein
LDLQVGGDDVIRHDVLPRDVLPRDDNHFRVERGETRSPHVSSEPRRAATQSMLLIFRCLSVQVGDAEDDEKRADHECAD